MAAAPPPAVCFAVPRLAVHQCRKSFGFYKTSRVCSACVFCSRLSASLPSGKRENVSATDLPVLLALVKPFLLCICPWSAPLPAAAPQQHTHRVLPSSCSIPGPAIARTQPMCQGRLLPGWLALPFSGEQVRALPCFSSGDRQSCVAFFLSVAVAHRTGGALLYSTSSPSDKLGRNFRVTTGCANVLMQ